MTIHLSRDGESIGTYSLDEIKQDISSGKLKETDLVWHDNSTDWITLREFYDSLWKFEPASPDQLGFLASFGVTPEKDLTKGEASDLLEKLSNDPSLLAPSPPTPSPTEDFTPSSLETPTSLPLPSTDSSSEKEKTEIEFSSKKSTHKKIAKKNPFPFHFKFWGYTLLFSALLLTSLILIASPFQTENPIFKEWLQFYSEPGCKNLNQFFDPLTSSEKKQVVTDITRYNGGSVLLLTLLNIFGAWGLSSFLASPGHNELWKAWVTAFIPTFLILLIGALVYDDPLGNFFPYDVGAREYKNENLNALNVIFVTWLPNGIQWIFIMMLYRCSFIQSVIFSFLMVLFSFLITFLFFFSIESIDYYFTLLQNSSY